MHEVALMGDILGLIQADIEKKSINIVDSIELLVGELSNAMPEALDMAFSIWKARQEVDFLTEKTVLTIIRQKALAECVICNLQYEPTRNILVCPECKFPSGKLITGEELQVLSYEGRELDES